MRGKRGESNVIRPGTQAMAEVRQDCINRKGDCAGCLHAVPSLGNSCMIRHTAQVVAALGGETIAARLGIGATCQECGGDFFARLSTARFCEPCRQERTQEALRKRKETLKASHQAKACDICRVSYTPLVSSQRYCAGCKSQDLRLYECGGCGCEYVAAGRQKYTRRCDECKTAQRQAG